MAELIATGTTLANSADFTVAAGAPTTLYIKPASGDGPPPFGVDFHVQHKTSGGNYSTIAVLNAANITQFGTIAGVGIFRVQRQASAVSAGMDRD